MCSSAPNSGYLVNTGEFFAGCSDEDNSVNFIRTATCITVRYRTLDRDLEFGRAKVLDRTR